MHLKPLLACAASGLVASATLAAGGTASAAGQAPQPANVSDFLAGQLAGLTGRTSVMVHGTSITAARQAVTATPADIERALKVSAHKFTDGAAYTAGPLGTTSYDKGYGLVDVVAAVAALG